MANADRLKEEAVALRTQRYFILGIIIGVISSIFKMYTISLTHTVDLYFIVGIIYKKNEQKFLSKLDELEKAE
jgi:hypothetical protein